MRRSLRQDERGGGKAKQKNRDSTTVSDHVILRVAIVAVILILTPEQTFQ
jgi:hypothetical protein